MKPPVNVRQYGSSAFTLIEMLGVLFVIITLIGILYPTISKVRTRAKCAKAQAEIEALGVALRMYESDLGKYPPKISVVDPDKGAMSGELYNHLGRRITSIQFNLIVGPYMEFKIKDLGTNNAYLDPWGRGYVYMSKDEPPPPPAHNTYSFDIYSFGPDGRGSTIDDVKNW